MVTRMALLFLAGCAGAVLFQVGERLSIPGVQGLISPAQAIVGRPLTPLSVAGVARRTARRCAVGVYNC